MARRGFWRWSLILGPGLLAGAGCSTIKVTPQRTVLAREVVELPTFARGDLLFIDARVNGAGPFRLLVDTGSTSLALAADAAQAAGLNFRAKDGVFATPVTTMKTGVARVDVLESGGMRLEGLDAILLPPGDVASVRRTFGPFDGLLGINALKEVILQMDFPHQRVSVARPGAQAYPLPRGVAYADSSGRCPQVMITIGKKTVAALIDTGSNFNLILPDLASYPLLQPVMKDDGLGGFAVGSAVGNRGSDAQLAGTARLGPITWTNPPLREQSQGWTANIGVPLLNTWTLAFDQRAHRVYFLGAALDRTWEKEKRPEPRFHPGYLANAEGTALRLVEVDAGGAFELAGLRTGDLILTIDGSPAFEFIKHHDLAEASRRILRVEREETIFQAALILQAAGLPQ